MSLMGLTLKEVKTYHNFDELATDMLDIAKEILPGKMVYLNSLLDQKQVTLKIAGSNPFISLKEGSVIPINEAVCNRVDFMHHETLIYEDLSKVESLDDVKKFIESTNINAYMGIPIALDDGEPFGTLCAAYHEATHFDEKSIVLLQKLAKMFSYYLQVEHLAYKDPLTGVFNRQYLYKFKKDIISKSRMLFSIDLDGFKAINDLLGHEKGDEVLTEMGKKLDALILEMKRAYVVRTGGDEFLIFIGDSMEVEDIIIYAKRILDTLSSWETDLKKLTLTASVGVVTYQADKNQDLKKLIASADDALYKAKRAGRNQYHIEF